MKCGRLDVLALFVFGHVLIGCATSAFAADAAAQEAGYEAADVAGETTSAKHKTTAKWYRLRNITIPEECSLRNQGNFKKPPYIFVEIEKDGERIFRSSVEKGWSVDYPSKKNLFTVDDPDAVYTIQIWDDCWWDENICNITGLSSDAFAKTIYQKGGQYDTKERLLSVQFQEVPAP